MDMDMDMDSSLTKLALDMAMQVTSSDNKCRSLRKNSNIPKAFRLTKTKSIRSSPHVRIVNIMGGSNPLLLPLSIFSCCCLYR